MEVLRINDKNEFIFSFDDFVSLVRENMGDDSASYIDKCPELFSWDRAIKFDLNNEKIANRYKNSLKDINKEAGVLYQMIIDSELLQGDKYRKFKSDILQQIIKIKVITDVINMKNISST